MPVPDHGMGPENKEVPCSNKGGGNGAIGVLKCKDQRRQ